MGVPEIRSGDMQSELGITLDSNVYSTGDGSKDYCQGIVSMLEVYCAIRWPKQCDCVAIVCSFPGISMVWDPILVFVQ